MGETKCCLPEDKKEKKANCDMICGNSVDIEVTHRECEIHADIVVKQLEPSIRLWGQIKDCYGNPVKGCLLKLLKVVEKCGKVEYCGIAHTVADCEGFYQFDLPKPCYGARYKIIVSKAATGGERKIEDAENCNCCTPNVCEM